MIAVGENDSGERIVLVSDKPRARLEMVDGVAEALYAQLGLLLKTRARRRGEAVRLVEVGLDMVLEPEVAAEQAAPLRPGPAPAVRRMPDGSVVTSTGATLIDGDPRAAAEARDAAEIAARNAKANGGQPGAQDDARVSKRKARVAAARAAKGLAPIEEEVEELDVG